MRADSLAGDFFGELGCLLGSLRACSVYALSDCEMYTLSAESLKSLSRSFPKAIQELKNIAKERRASGDQMQKHKKKIATAIATATKQGSTNIDAVGAARLSEDVAGNPELKEKIEQGRRSTFVKNNGSIIEGMMEGRLGELEKTLARVLELLEKKDKKAKGGGADEGHDGQLNI